MVTSLSILLCISTSISPSAGSKCSILNRDLVKLFVVFELLGCQVILRLSSANKEELGVFCYLFLLDGRANMLIKKLFQVNSVQCLCHKLLSCHTYRYLRLGDLQHQASRIKSTLMDSAAPESPKNGLAIFFGDGSSST